MTSNKNQQQVGNQSCQKSIKISQLIDFDGECDQLEQPSSSQGDKQNSEMRQSKSSMISSETQQIRNQTQKKVNDYLLARKFSIPNNNFNRNTQYLDEPDGGALVQELDKMQQLQQKNKKVQSFILDFNKKPQQAINDYILKNYILDSKPQSIASYLIGFQGLNKQVLGEYFGKNDPTVLAILHSYCTLLNFKGQQFDKAIRILLSKFRLPLEAQQIQRVIWQFSLSFYEANQQSYDNADQLFPLAYAIIMLATDAHNPKQEKKMSSQDFVINTQRACPSISHQYLNNIYNRIVKEKFQTQVNYMETLYDRIGGLTLENLKRILQFTNQLIKGDIFLKICRQTNKFVQRKIYLSENQKRIQWITDPPKGYETPRYIEIKDIIDLTLGRGSAVMQKNKVPQQFDSLCFTITTTRRTLDLKAKTNKDRAKWLNYLRVLLIQIRQNKKELLEKNYISLNSKEAIEDAWNTKIFPFWDQHWDYKNRKPKQKGYIDRGIDYFCCCRKQKQQNNIDKSNNLGIPIGKTLLGSLWKHGLPNNSRKTLWILVIGNALSMKAMMIDEIKKRRKEVQQFNSFGYDSTVVEMGQFILAMRPDIPAIREILLISEIFYKIFDKNLNSSCWIGLANVFHRYHFLAFYRGQKAQIDLRIHLFDYLMIRNVPVVKQHLQGLKLQTRLFFVGWFLSIFANFSSQLVYRIWDNFLLEGEIFLFKVGITLIKYYEIELKMCTFKEGLKILKFPKNTSIVLFFHILENQIDVSPQDYFEYIEKRKHAIIKTEVQAIPLE